MCERLESFWKDVTKSPGPWPIVPNGGNAADEEEVGVTELDPEKYPLQDVTRQIESVHAVSRPPALDPQEYTRTVLLVSHGSALSNLMNNVLLRKGYVTIKTAVPPHRIANCSISEIHIPHTDAIGHGAQDGTSRAHRPGEFVKWAGKRSCHITAESFH